MLDREKVIKGLECCMDILHAGPGWSQGCIQCPYAAVVDVGRYPCMRLLANDALKLIKTQEPGALTLEELGHMEHKPVYLQCKNSRLYIAEPAILLKAKRCYVQSLGENYIFMREHKVRDTYWECDYNVTWRCWTSCPTDEQRKAVKWDD